MKNRTFNSIMHPVNEAWTAQVLNMQINPEKGPDLIDDNKVVECKFKIVYPDKYMHISWRTLEHQLSYNVEKPAFWAFGTYLFNQPVSAVKTKDPEKLESMVLERQLWIVDWDWVNQFPAYTQTGRTAISEWENVLRFPKGNKLPNITHQYKVHKGAVYITENVPPEAFNIQTV